MRQVRAHPRLVHSEVYGCLVVQENDSLGKGTYGQVFKAVGQNNPNLKKAIKFLNPETVLENEGIPATTLREVNAMKSINCANVMNLEDVVYKGGPENFAMVMDLMRGTLASKIQHIAKQYLHGKECYATYLPVPGKHREFREHHPTTALPADYVKETKVIAWQLLNGVAACHANGVIHRDIKPANILWSNDDVMKIGDFGLARFQRGERSLSFTVPQQTGEICTLQYRAPEVLLGDETYGLRVDDWSVGCCIAEMFHLKLDPNKGGLASTPIFSGTTELSNLIVIFDLCGTPVADDPTGYLQQMPWWSSSFPVYEGRLREMLPLIDNDGFDLISRLLVLDPLHRSSSRELLKHPWFDDIAKENLLNRFQPWDAGIKDKIVRMRSIIDHTAVTPSPYWGKPQKAFGKHKPMTGVGDENRDPKSNSDPNDASRGLKRYHDKEGSDMKHATRVAYVHPYENGTIPSSRSVTNGVPVGGRVSGTTLKRTHHSHRKNVPPSQNGMSRQNRLIDDYMK